MTVAGFTLAVFESPVELRFDGRSITGVAMPYGTLADRPGFRERFAPGALQWSGRNVRLNLGHHQEAVIADTERGTLEIREEGDRLVIKATPTDSPTWHQARQDILAGRLRGLSVEFRSLADNWTDHTTRVITRAELHGVGIVAQPAYPTTVELRTRKQRLKYPSWL